MPALKWQEKINQRTLYQIGYQYLIENFHKFKEDNKIKVALDVIHIFNRRRKRLPVISYDIDKGLE